MPVNSIKCANCKRDDFDDFEDFQKHDCVIDFDDDDGGAPKVAADGGTDLTVWRHLTAFQRDILRAIRIVDASSEEDTYGLALKRQLETMYGEEINHGRLYPNLDTLVDKSLIQKSKLDDRTNEYRLTSTGRELLEYALSVDAGILRSPSEASTSAPARPDGGRPGGGD